MEPYNEKVIEHYSNPRNVGEIPDASGVGEVGNPVCGDIMKMYLKIENGIITDVKFKTFGCGAAIATSSVSTELIKGKTVEEAEAIIHQYFNMIDAKEYDPDVLEEAVALKNVYKQANRIKCATIGWKAIDQMIHESEEKE